MSEGTGRGQQRVGDGAAPGMVAATRTTDVSSDPKEALRQAEEAITRLEQSAAKERDVSRWTTVAIVAVCVLAFAGIVVHTFYEEEAPKVDETSALLLAVLLFAPFVRYLRALEFGGAKAEFQDDTSTGLSAVLSVVRAEHDAILRIYDSLTAQTATEAEEGFADRSTPAAAAPPSTVEELPAPRPLRRILWVDDNPEGNTYELDALRKLFDVTTMRTTQEAERLLKTGGFDAVISDIVRNEDGQVNYQAGAQVAAMAAAMQPPTPVFCYASDEAVRLQSQGLTEIGVVAVTSSYVDLVRAIRLQARVSFDAAVRNAVQGIPNPPRIAEQVGDIDFILDFRGGPKVAVETPHWLRVQQTKAVQARYDKLSQAIEERRVDRALLVTQKDLLTVEQKRSAPANVQPVVLDDLANRLASLATEPHEKRLTSR
jgi:CheY-like chemotaxis protein